MRARPRPDLLEGARALAETDAQVRRARQLITATLETLLTENPATKSITEILEWVDPDLADFLDPEERACWRGDAPVDREELRLVASVLRQGDKFRRQQAAELSRRLRLFIRYEKAAAARRLRESQELRRKRALK